MSKIKEALKALGQDLATIEVALLEEESPGKVKVLAYSRTEMEGDTVAYLDLALTEDQVALVKSLQEGASNSRAAVLKMVAAIIT